MRLRILGSGTSSGVPRIGNDWGCVDPKEPRNRRLRSAALATIADTRLLIDAGPDLREQLNTAGVSTVARVILTHDHADHIHGLDDLRQLAHNGGGQVVIHAREAVVRQVGSRFRYLFEGNSLYPAVCRAESISGEWNEAGVRLRFVDQPHGNITSLGLRFDKGAGSLVYAIDFHHLTDAMAALYQKCDIWVADCLRRRPHPTHAHLDAVLGWARDLGVGQLVLTHLDNSMDHAQLRSELPDWAAPAYDGMELEI